MQIEPKNELIPVVWENIQQLSDDALWFRPQSRWNNRNTGPCLIAAESDIEAVSSWLSDYVESPQSFRAYRKEAERFVAWLCIRVGKTLAEVTREDISGYAEFLRNPLPRELWCGSRTIKRTDPRWRPFEGPLSDKSISFALAALGSLFGYLQEMGYFRLNPLVRIRKARGRVKDKRTKDSQAPVTPEKALIRYFPGVLFDRLSQFLEECCLTEKSPLLYRGTFVFQFLGYTGLRRAELADARLQDIIFHEEAQIYTLSVIGKGDKDRLVVLTSQALRAIDNYLAYYGLSRESANPQQPILMDLIGNRQHTWKTVSEDLVYRIIEDTLRYIKNSESLELLPQYRELLERASPHWMRRTFATLCLERGVGLKHVQEQLGHSSESTTLTYQTSALSLRAAELDRIQPRTRN